MKKFIKWLDKETNTENALFVFSAIGIGIYAIMTLTNIIGGFIWMI